MSIDNYDIWIVKMARGRKGNHDRDTQCSEANRMVKGNHQRERTMNCFTRNCEIVRVGRMCAMDPSPPDHHLNPG